MMAERLIRALKSKIYKKLEATGNKSYLGYLNNLVDKYSNNYHHAIGEKSIDADFPALIEKIESSHKTPKFKVGDRVGITKYNNIFSTSYTKN